MFDQNKFKALVHYICRKYALTPEKLGKTKLQKILWYSDTRSFALNGKPITGAPYIKKKFGPFTKELDKALNDLSSEGKVAVKPSQEKYEVTELRGKGTADVGLFDQSEMSLIDEYCEQIAEGHTAASISEQSHKKIWKTALMGEEIPYYLFRTRTVTPTTKTMDWAKREIGKLRK